MIPSGAAQFIGLSNSSKVLPLVIGLASGLGLGTMEGGDI